MRSSAYYLYIDLFVSGRYIAFVAGFIVLASTFFSLLLTLILIIHPVAVPRSHLKTVPQPNAAHFNVTLPASIATAQPAGRALLAGVALALPILALALMGAIPGTARLMLTQVVRTIRDTGPPARGSIPINLKAVSEFTRNYLSPIVPQDPP